MKKLVRYMTIAIPLLSLIASTAYPQVPNFNIGDAVKQATPPPKEAKEAPPPKETPVIVEEEKPFSLAEGEKLFVRDFRIEGALKEDEPRLSALLDPYRNRDLTMAEITEAANRLTLFYRERGYLVAKAYVPKQDATGGILLIRVVMGAYGKFSLKNTSLVRDSIIRGVFDRAKDTKEVTKEGLERSMLLVRDMPGAKLPTVAIAPGALPGTSDFDVTVDRSQRFNGYVMADNQGSRYTGKNRIYGGIDLNSPLGIADRLSFSGMTTNQNDGLENLRLSYGFPVSHNGLRTEFAASRTTYSLGGIYSDLDATGSADVLEGTISYPLRRTSSESIDVSLNVAYKELHDDLSAVESRNPRDDAIATLALQRGAYGTLFGRNLFTAMTASASGGTLRIRDDVQKTLNDAGANTSGTFAKLNLGFSGNLELSDRLSARGSLRLQKVLSAHNLDPVEQFFISGASGVKAYTESVSFDNGYVVNAEVRYNLPSLHGMTHALGAFVDNGWVYAQKNNYTDNDRIMLTDAGLGYYLTYRKLFGSVQLAQPIGRSSVNDPGTRILAQVGMAF